MQTESMCDQRVSRAKLAQLSSRKLAQYIEANPHLVADIDYEDGYCTPSGKAYDVLMAPGYVVDYYGDELHWWIGETAKEAIALLKTARPCDCDECKQRSRGTEGRA